MKHERQNYPHLWWMMLFIRRLWVALAAHTVVMVTTSITSIHTAYYVYRYRI